MDKQRENNHGMICPACGAGMKYNPELGTLHCEHCNTQCEIKMDRRIEETSFDEAVVSEARDWNEDDVKLIKCSKCGAKLVFEAQSQVKQCRYCGSTSIDIVVDEKTISPGYVIPFSIGEKEAIKAFGEWIQNCTCAPSDIRKLLKLDVLRGLYVPVWTYDVEVEGFYTADRGDYYYITKTREVDGKTKTYEERRTRWSYVNGPYKNFFDDVLVAASPNAKESLLRTMGGVNAEKLVKYKSEYLAGFAAEKYSITLEAGWEEAKKAIVDKITDDMKAQIGGDALRNLNYNLEFKDITFKHLLLPVWKTKYKYNEKLYEITINGITGEVEGKYPKSILQIIKNAGLMLFAIALFIFIIYEVGSLIL